MRTRNALISPLHTRLRYEHLEDRRLLAVVSLEADEFTGDPVIDFNDVEDLDDRVPHLMLERTVDRQTVSITLDPEGITRPGDSYFPSFSGGWISAYGDYPTMHYPPIVTIELEAATSRIGFDFGNGYYSDNGDLQVAVYGDDNALIGSESFTPILFGDPNDGTAEGFAGVGSDVPFSRVVVTWQDWDGGGIHLDNLRFAVGTVVQFTSSANISELEVDFQDGAVTPLAFYASADGVFNKSSDVELCRFNLTEAEIASSEVLVSLFGISEGKRLTLDPAGDDGAALRAALEDENTSTIFAVGDPDGDYPSAVPFRGFYQASGSPLAVIRTGPDTKDEVTIGPGTLAFTAGVGADAVTKSTAVSDVGSVLIVTAELDDVVTIQSGVTANLIVKAGAGDDTLDSGGGDDELDGGAGKDIYNFQAHSAGQDTISETGAEEDRLDFTFFGEGIDIDLANTAAQEVGLNLTLTLPTATAIEHVTGSEFDDFISGNSLQNEIHGRGGDDDLIGCAGGDNLYGDVGVDVLLGGGFGPSISGPQLKSFMELLADKKIELAGVALTPIVDGWNELFGGDDFDVLLGGAGGDTIDAGAGGSIILADSFGASLNLVFDFSSFLANPSFDSAKALLSEGFKLEGAITLPGGGATNTIHGGSGFDLVFGGNGKDVVTGGGGSADVVFGFGGGDIVNAEGTESLVVFGGGGDDIVTGGVDFNLLVGGENDDSLTGAAGRDVLIGDSFNFGVNGEDGLKQFFTDLTEKKLSFQANLTASGSGNDTLRGLDGFDILVGGDGVDSLLGGDGGGLLFGDSFDLSVGPSELGFGEIFDGHDDSGDPKTDDAAKQGEKKSKAKDLWGKLLTLLGTPEFTLQGTGGDTIVGGSGIDLIVGGEGNDTGDGGIGGSFCDLLIGNEGYDTLQAHQTFFSMMIGGEGDDTLEASTIAGSLGSILLGDGFRFLGVPANLASLFTFEFNGLLPVEMGITTGLVQEGVGIDKLVGAKDGFNLLLGGDGSDTLEGHGLVDVMFGDFLNLGIDVSIDFSGVSLDNLLEENFTAIDTSFELPGLAGEGDDTIKQLGDGFTVAVGGAGGDTIVGSSGPLDILFGNGGVDNITGNAGFNVIVGGDGSDVLTGGDDNNIMLGDAFDFNSAGILNFNELKQGRLTTAGGLTPSGTGNDKITGGNSSDFIVGGHGVDEIIAGDGLLDVIFGDTFNLAVGFSFDFSQKFGASTFAQLFSDVNGALNLLLPFTGAGNGGDTVHGGEGLDLVVGGAGNDKLFGEGSFDFLVGGDGDDEVDGGGGFTLTSDDGDIVFGGAGHDKLFGGDGDDHLESEDGDDQFFGQGGNDTIAGGAGRDLLSGGPGDDVLAGEAGDDSLYGGEGDDQLFGGGGNDLLVPGAGSDTIEDNEGSNRVIVGADYNGNGVVDQSDYGVWKTAFGSQVELSADGNNDGVVDAADYTFWRDNLGAVVSLPSNFLPGDFNGDGVVDAADYTVWRDTLGSTTDLRANGDNTGLSAGVIDQTDYDVWKTHFGQTLPPGASSGAAASGEEQGASALLSVATETYTGNAQTTVDTPLTTFRFPLSAIRLHSAFDPRFSSLDPHTADSTRPGSVTTLLDRLGAAVRQDSALLAWLASLTEGVPRHDVAEVDGFVDDRPADKSTDTLFGAVDEAFGALSLMPAAASHQFINA